MFAILFQNPQNWEDATEDGITNEEKRTSVENFPTWVRAKLYVSYVTKLS